MEKIVVFRSEGGRYIDMILRVSNFDDRFYRHAYDAVDAWNQTDEEFVDYVTKYLEESGYVVKPEDYYTINDD